MAGVVHRPLARIGQLGLDHHPLDLEVLPLAGEFDPAVQAKQGAELGAVVLEEEPGVTQGQSGVQPGH